MKETQIELMQAGRRNAAPATHTDIDRLQLPEAQAAAVKKRFDEMPPRYRKIYLRAVRGKSVRAAVRAFCLECFGWERGEIAGCTSPACPLYPYRPYRA
jgi:hypothetical protein